MKDSIAPTKESPAPVESTWLIFILLTIEISLLYDKIVPFDPKVTVTIY